MFDEFDEPEKTLAAALYQMDKSDDDDGDGKIESLAWFDREENAMLGNSLSVEEKEKMIAESKTKTENADEENIKRAAALTEALKEYFQAKAGAGSEEA